MAKRPAQGRGSGGRVTPSPRTRARVPKSADNGSSRSQRGKAPAPAPTQSPSLLRRILDPAGTAKGAGEGGAERVERERPWWGFGDVLLWLAVGQLLTAWVSVLIA